MRKKIILLLVIINGIIKLANGQTDNTNNITHELKIKNEILLTLDQDTKLFQDALVIGNASNAYIAQMTAIKNEHDSVYKNIIAASQRNYDCLKQHNNYEDSINTKMYRLEEISVDISSDDTFDGLLHDKITIINGLIIKFQQMESVYKERSREWSEMANQKMLGRKK